jgi:hypothetical protein
MPIPGQPSAAALQSAGDAIGEYLSDNAANMSASQQNGLNDDVTQIDLQIQSITTNGVIDALDPGGQLFTQLSGATQKAKGSLDNLARVQQTIAKAIGIATAVLGLATAVASGDVLAIGGAIVNVNNAAQ